MAVRFQGSGGNSAHAPRSARRPTSSRNGNRKRSCRTCASDPTLLPFHRRKALVLPARCSAAGRRRAAAAGRASRRRRRATAAAGRAAHYGLRRRARYPAPRRRRVVVRRRQPADADAAAGDVDDREARGSAATRCSRRCATSAAAFGETARLRALASAAALFLSLRYHLLHPAYLMRRMREMAHHFTLRLVLPSSTRTRPRSRSSS